MTEEYFFQNEKDLSLLASISLFLVALGIAVLIYFGIFTLEEAISFEMLAFGLFSWCFGVYSLLSAIENSNLGFYKK